MKSRKLFTFAVFASCLCTTVGVDLARGQDGTHTSIISVRTASGDVTDAAVSYVGDNGQFVDAVPLGDGTFQAVSSQKLRMVVTSKAAQVQDLAFDVTLPSPSSDVVVLVDSGRAEVAPSRSDGAPSISPLAQQSSAAGQAMTRAVGSAIPTGGPGVCGPDQVTQSQDTTTITPLNSVSCNAGGLHTDNSYYRQFDVDVPFAVCSVTIGIETATSAGGTQPISVLLYDTPVTALGAPIGSAMFDIADQDATIVTLDVAGETATGILTVEIFTPDGQGVGNSFFIGSNPNGQTAPSYIAAAACGLPDPADLASIGFPDMHIIMIVTGGDTNCGDGTCDPAEGEDCCSCPQDCGDCVCGDGTCQDCEDCANCPADCGGPCVCGNGIVEPGEECDPPDGVNCDDECQFICEVTEDCNCDGICAAGCGDCEVPNPAGLPGCSDDACEAIVCAVDPFCCQTAWDGICAGEATDLCDCGGGENCVTCPGDCDDGDGPLCECGNGIVEEELGEECDPPDGETCLDGCVLPPPPDCCDGTELEEGEACGDDTNGGCNSSPPAFVNALCGDTYCGTAWADGGTRDTDWYLISHSGGIVSATVASSIPTTLFVVDGVCDCAPVVVGDIGCGDGCASIAPGMADLPAGNYVIFVGAGDCGGGGIFEGFPCGNPLGNEYSVSITCNQGEEPVCGNGMIEGCEECDDGNTVPGDGCDENCFLEACPGEGGDCCEDGGNGTPGCDDVACCEEVCGADPFCCDVSWDGICAGIALDLCSDPGEVCAPECGNGNCQESQGENNENCPADCFCGNGNIEEGDGEECDPPDGTICDVDCTFLPLPNDDCADAIQLEVPSSTTGSTVGADPDPGVPTCGTSVTVGGVWYTVMGTGNTMTASTCTDFFGYDTKISVFCGDCPAGVISDCCESNGTPGCDDPDCEATVCAADPFCCDTSWDGICAGAAEELCGDLCGGGEGGLVCVDGNDDNCPDGASGLLSTVTWCSQAGAEYLIFVHGFGSGQGVFQLELSDDGGPCSGGVQCLPEGACCVGADCVATTTQQDCEENLGGSWFEGETCEGLFVGYIVEECSNEYVDISGTGTLVPSASNSDDGGEVVPLGFTFSFYGDSHDSIGVASNGYLTFGPDLTDFSNDPIPTATDPNDAMFPWWDDWNPSAAGDVYTQQFLAGPGPVRAMFQWTNVEHFGGGAFGNFQVIVFESGAIEYRYADPIDLVSPTVGVENQDGSDGTSVDPGTVGPGTCLRFTPLTEEGFDGCAEERSLIIKQGACPAPVNPNSNGVIPMALIGDVDFDVSTVDLDSLDLHLCGGGDGIAPLNGPPGPSPQIVDINHPFTDPIDCEEGPCACNDDQSSDGIADLKLKFSTDEFMAALGDALVPGAVVVVELSGETTDGTAFIARDCVQVVPPGGAVPSNFAVEASTPRAYTELQPWDMNLDTDGFGSFLRAYPAGETVTLTADLVAPNGSLFDHWVVNGVTWRQGVRTVTVTVTEDMTLGTVYVGPQPADSPQAGGRSFGIGR